MKRSFFKLEMFLIFTLALFMFFSLMGCTEETKEVKEPEKEEKQEENKKEVEKEKKEAEKEEKKEEKMEIDYDKVEPNELGRIKILMYHDIGNEDGSWKTSRENFREHMERLYEKDYRLVDLMDVVNGEIDIPAGTTPVVLTFDDGHPGQFDLVEKEGEKIVDPDSAAGIILELEEKYDDFTVAGNFYINRYPVPFGDADRLDENLEVLTEKGFSVGNHGYEHMHLNQAQTNEEVQRELGKVQKMVNDALNGYKLESLALAYGLWPNEEFKDYVFSGEYEGTSYEHKAVLNVGSDPDVSPFHKDFDPLDLERVRANDGESQEMDRWLEYFENNPEKRYKSDGNPNTVVFPEEKKENLNEDIEEGYQIITY